MHDACIEVTTNSHVYSDVFYSYQCAFKALHNNVLSAIVHMGATIIVGFNAPSSTYSILIAPSELPAVCMSHAMLTSRDPAQKFLRFHCNSNITQDHVISEI